MSFAVMGKGVLALTRQGDYSMATIRPVSKSLPISCTVVSSQYGKSLPLNVNVIRPSVSPLLLAVRIAPTPAFAINGDSNIVSPDQLTYQPPQLVARTLLGGGLLQGYKNMVWQYSVLPWDEYAHLLSFYNAQQPVVTLTFPDEYGLWAQRSAVMLPPTYGSLQNMLVYGITLTFTRL